MTRPNIFLEWYEVWIVYSNFNILQKLLTEFCSQIYKKNGIGPELTIYRKTIFFPFKSTFSDKKIIKKTITFLIFGGYREEEWGYKFFSILFHAIRWF